MVSYVGRFAPAVAVSLAFLTGGDPATELTSSRSNTTNGDATEFQEAFHRIYWGDFADYESFLAAMGGQRQVGSYVATFYDQVGALLRRDLIDYDLASNNGGWQWAASTGCDAQPYFRMFNPVAQSQRFDPDGKFIRRYVPELKALDGREIHAPWNVAQETLKAKGIVIGRDYPLPIVDHAAARNAALALFKAATAGDTAER